MAADGKVTIQISADSKEAEDSLDRVKGKTDQVGDSAESTGSKSEAGFGAVALGAGAAAAALITATKAAVDYADAFEAAFAKTQTIMDTNVMSAEAMKGEVLDLSAATGMAATDVSEAVYQAISGSVDTANAVGFVDKANRLAVAGFTSLTNATDILTTTLNAYGMEQSQVGGISNVLIKTQNLGKTSVDELSSSMGKAIATGSAYGVNLQNIATAYVELTKGGIATAEATTYVSGMMNELGKSTSDVAKILTDQTGQSFGQLMASGASLGDVLQILYEYANNDAEAFMNLWGSQEAAKAANALMTQGVEDFNEVAAQMNDELAGVTSTTDDAYATMTNTSEFVKNRLTNSIKNLGVAYGEQLAPFINDCAEGLTKFVEGATEFVKEHPGVSAAMTGMAASLAAIAAGYALYTAGAKVAQKATEALTSAMATNPYLLLGAAIAAVVVALGTMAAVMISDMNEAYEQNVQKARELTSTLESNRAAMQDNLATVDASADMANQYIDRLEELEATGLKTTEQQQEYHSILMLLTQTVPELADQIDLETDSIEGGTAALRIQTEAWRENAKAQAMQEYLTDLYSKHAAVLVEMQKNQNRLTDAEIRAGSIEDELSDRYERRDQLLSEANRKAEDASRTYGGLADATSYLTEEYYQNEAAIDALNNELGLCNDEMVDAKNQIDEGQAAVDAAQDEINATTDAIAELTGAIDDGGNAAANASAAAQAATVDLAAWEDAVASLTEEYYKAKDAAAKSLDSQINYFEKAAEVVPQSVTDITAALNSQAAYMNQYAQNLKRAAEMGINEGLLKSLSDGSTESAAILAGIVADEGQHIDEMNEAWGKVSQGRDTLSSEMALYSDKVEEAGDEMTRIAGEAGVSIGSELTSSLASGYGAFSAQVAQYEERLRQLQRLAAMATMTQQYDGRGYYTTTHYAGGTDYAKAGYAIVGEEGPELVMLRGGERILTADETKAATRTISPAPGMSWTGETAPATLGGYRQTETTIIVPVQLDGREIARTTATYMGEEMAFEVM